MTHETSVTCPNCGVLLPTGGLGQGVNVQCAQCGTQFPLPSPALTTGTSGKAIASLVLGLVSVVGICFTGIPAIILGIVALGETGQGPGRRRGRGMAIGGIVTGSLCGLLCLPLFGLLFMSAREVGKGLTREPPRVTAIASKIGMPEAPAGVNPIMAVDGGIFGFKVAVYADRKENPNTGLMMLQIPSWLPWNRNQIEEQMRQTWKNENLKGINVEETRQLTFTIRGKPVQVTELIGTEEESGQHGRMYMAFLTGDAGSLMVMLMTDDTPEDDSKEAESETKKVRLTEEQVKEFFEAIR